MVWGSWFTRPKRLANQLFVVLQTLTVQGMGYNKIDRLRMVRFEKLQRWDDIRYFCDLGQTDQFARPVGP
jgi:hypothetical protein